MVKYEPEDEVVKLDIEVGIKGKAGFLNLRDEWAKGTIEVNGKKVPYAITRSMMSPHMFIELEGKRPVIIHVGTILQAVAELGDKLEWKKDKEDKKP